MTNPGLTGGQRLVRQVPAFERPGTKILDDDVGARGERARDRLAVERAQIDRRGSLAAGLDVPPQRRPAFDVAPFA